MLANILVLIWELWINQSRTKELLAIYIYIAWGPCASLAWANQSQVWLQSFLCTGSLCQSDDPKIPFSNNVFKCIKQNSSGYKERINHIVSKQKSYTTFFLFLFILMSLTSLRLFRFCPMFLDYESKGWFFFI